MRSILIGSCGGYSGKSAICIGLAMIFREKGLKIGYMKPFGNQFREVKGKLVDEDARNICNALGLKDDLETITPVMLTDNFYHRALTEGVDVKDDIIKAYKKLSEGKDVIIIEGNEDLPGGVMYDMSDIDIANALQTRILLVSKYHGMQEIDNILNDRKMIGDPRQLTGIILNDVIDPDEASHIAVPFLKKKGVTVFGTIPRDPVLKSISIGEIAEAAGTRILIREDMRDVLVEHFLIGAMEANTALKYFRRVQNFALITGGDRTDIQLAGLEAGVKCIILTGNMYPSSAMLGAARERGVPVMVVSEDTMSTVGDMEAIIGRTSR
ncbi:MAG: AAA family ATPase [Nitrospiraceae bacterium]|nr:AAA family ATPase [Nitrospiraceae bacterium]